MPNQRQPAPTATPSANPAIGWIIVASIRIPVRSTQSCRDVAIVWRGDV
jgi:hypothetical protein